MNAENRVKEAQQAFQADGQAGAKSKRYRAKVFKSGNSLALRLPAELGLEAGIEMELEAQDGVYTFRPVASPRRKIDVSGFAGKAPWLKPLPPELREFEERPSTIAARKRLEEEGRGEG